MKLGELITEDVVLFDFSAVDKWAAIEKLVDYLVESGKVDVEKRKAILDALVAREGIASTGMEHGVALPHASVDILDEAIACLAISSDGVPFESADEASAKIIILLVIPRRRVKQHIATLAAIARLLNSAEMRESLLAAGTPADLVAVLQKEEQLATGVKN